MNANCQSKWMQRPLISVVAMLFSCLGTLSAFAESKVDSLDGIYTQPRMFLNDQGLEVEGFQMDHIVLELQGDRFKFWHFSDRIGSQKYPITGKYSRDGELLELESDDLASFWRRYVATTIKGVTGIWPEKKLQAWRNGEHPYSVPILVRVADGPSGKKLDQDSFKFPSVSPLLNKETARQFWTKEKKKHDARYMNVTDPLRTLLRERSSRDDDTREGYKELVLKQQQELDPKLIKQLLSEIGNGVSVVMGPKVLQDIFGQDSSYFDEPAFMKNDISKRAALQTLVDAMPEVKNERALNAALLVFLRSTGLKQIDLTCAGDERVKLSWGENGRRSIKSYHFSEAVRSECQSWANECLVRLFGDIE